MERATTEEIRLILKMISRGYKVPKVIHDVIFEVAKREIEDGEKVILYKRDPNIHSRRIQGAYVKIIEGETLDINPLACGGFGADFDGDTTYCFLRVYKRDHNRYVPKRIHISEFDKQFKCELDGESCNGDTGVLIKNFNVLDNVYCQAISSNGNIKYKKITHWSIHENLDMFSINRKKRNCLIGDIKELWVSKDHSLVAIDTETQQITKATPEELINSPQRYFLIKSMEHSTITKDARRIMLDEGIWNNISEIEFGYYIGALLGDGDISGGQSCMHTSYSSLGHKWTDICETLIGDGKRSIVRDGKHSYNNEYNFRDKNGNEYKKSTHWGYRGWQVPFDINQFGTKCEDKHLPDWVINSTDDFTIGSFGGYIDTDGMIRPKEISVESKSKQLIDDFRFLLYYRLGVETSISEDFKNFNLGPGGSKIPILDPNDYRKYWVLHLPIRKEYTDFLNKVQELLNNPDKKKKLREYIDKCQSKPSTKRVLWVPREILKHPDFVKGRTDGVTSDIRFTIKKQCYTQKDMTIPDHIINESDITEAFKELLRKQNNKEIEIIPVNCLDIEHDPNMTVGYDFTVEDYATFTTDTGIFLYDTMAIFAPLSDEAQQEIKNKMITVNNTTKIGETNFFLEKDMVLGIFILTAERKKSPPKKIDKLEDVYKLHVGQLINITYKGKKLKTTAGRIIFNELLPKWHDIVDENVNKKKLTGLLSNILQKNENDYAVTVDKVKDAGFKYATLYPKSLDLELLKIPPSLVKLRDQLGQAKTVSEQSDILNEIDKKFAEHLEKERNDLYYIVESGSSKGILQPRQIVVCKGLVSDPEGNVLPPITTATNDGLAPREYFEASAGSRKGTADRAINTGNGGYAYRKMIFVVGNVQADKTIADCYTKRTLDIKLTNDLFKRMTGRFVQENDRIIDIDKSMIGHVIHLRSPIYCKTKKLCKTCYGKLLRQVNSENVGLVAVQEVASLSEKIMKSFHLGGAVIMQKVDIIQEIMGNVDDVFESRIRQSVKQVGEDLINNLDLTIIKIDKNVYEDVSNIEKEDDHYKLPVGFFSMMLNDIDIPIIIERPVKLYRPNEIEEDDRYITLMYTKNDKMFYVEAKQENFSDLARYLDTLVGGKYPKSDIVSIYNKFYKALAPVGGWDSVHLEIILSNILRARKDPQKPARLVEPFDPEMHSIKTLPNLISYPLGIAFENFSKGIQYGMISERAPESQIEKVMFGMPLTGKKGK